MSQNYEDRTNINRYLGKAADRRLAEIKGPAFAEYRRVFETARQEKVRTQWPIEISLGLTSYCNLLCKMCYRNYLPDNGKQYMPLGMVDEIVRQCKELDIASFWLGSFTEGLLHPDILYIIRKCGEVHALDYWFTTNGTLLTEDIARAMIESGVTKLHVSLDAATPETYKKIRGGNLEIVEKNVRRFLQIRNEMSSELPMLRVTMVEQDENRGEIDAFVNKWTGVADIVDVQKLTDYSILQNDELDRESYKHTFFDCYYPFYQLSVTYDGRIWPCPCPVFNSGHPVYLKDMTLKEYWNSKEILDIVHAIKNNEDYYDCCLKCLSLKPKR